MGDEEKKLFDAALMINSGATIVSGSELEEILGDE
jgi:hypothetical protein